MTKLPSSVLNFAQGKTDLYMAFADYFNQYRVENKLTDRPLHFDTSISFDEKSAKIHKELLSEIARHAQIAKFDDFPMEVWATHPNLKWATFAVVNALVDAILPETLIDSIGIYTDIRTGEMGSSFAFNIKPRDLFVVTKAGRGKRTSEVHKQFEGQVTVVPEENDITVAVSLYRVLAGQENLADFVMRAVKSIETQVTVDCFNAFNTAMGNLSTGVAGLKVAGYTQKDLVTLATKVTSYNMGAKAVVLGTPVALQSVLPDNSNYRYTLDSEYVKMGYIRTMANYDLMVVPQVADWQNPFQLLLDDTRLYIVSPSSQKIVKLCIEGATQAITSDVYANANLTQTTTLKKNWKAAVATNAVGALITLS